MDGDTLSLLLRPGQKVVLTTRTRKYVGVVQRVDRSGVALEERGRRTWVRSTTILVLEGK